MSMSTGSAADYLVDLTDPADPKSVLKSLIVDGEDHTNDWSITDFTMADRTDWRSAKSSCLYSHALPV